MFFQDYERNGAIIQEDISEASLIMGVKQVPIPRLLANKTYCFFSHTIKAQTENMPMLDQLLDKVIHSCGNPLLLHVSSIEIQKGVNADQRCSVENQKGAVAVQSLWW